MGQFIPLLGDVVGPFSGGCNALECWYLLEFLDIRFPHCIYHGNVNNGTLPEEAVFKQISFGDFWNELKQRAPLLAHLSC
jgi:hypothetical protein